MENTERGKYEWLKQCLEMSNGVPNSDTFRRSFERIWPKELGEMLHEPVDVNGKQLTLGQLATEEKFNGITAIPELFDMLSLKGSTVTVDAMDCQKQIVAKIFEKKADYVMVIERELAVSAFGDKAVF